MREEQSNKAFVYGRVCRKPSYSHTSKNTNYYLLGLECIRMSGAKDQMNVIFAEDVANYREINEGDVIAVCGRVKTFNMQTGEKIKLIIRVEAFSIAKNVPYLSGENHANNNLFIDGFVCKEPWYRTTPKGKHICNLLIAVNDSDGTSYIPCLAWGGAAKRARRLEVGARLQIDGSMQSRSYTKNLENGEMEQKVSFEVSIYRFTEVENEN